MTAMSRGLKIVTAAALLPALGGCYKSAPVPDDSRLATAKAIAKFWGATTATNQNNAAAEAFFDAVEAGEPDALLAFRSFINISAALQKMQRFHCRWRWRKILPVSLPC